MKKYLFLPILTICIGLFVSSCLEDDNLEELKKEEQTKLDRYLITNSIKEQPTASGMYVIISDSGIGSNAVLNDYALVNYTVRLINNTIIETNDSALAVKNDILPVNLVSGPVMFFVNKNAAIPGFIEGMTLLNEGAKARFIVPSKLAFGSYRSTTIPSYSTLIYDVELKKIIKDPIAYDRANVNRWVDSLGLQPSDSLENGVYLKIDSAGTGNLPVTGSKISLEYKGRFVDNRYFTSKYSAFDFYLGQNEVIAGFDSTIAKLKAGSYARFILPYKHAYGAGGRVNGYGQIDVPQYTSLVYQVKIKSIK